LSLRDYIPIFVENEYEASSALVKSGQLCGSLTVESSIELVRSYKNTRNQQIRMWANAQRNGRPAEHRWRPLFNAAKFG